MNVWVVNPFDDLPGEAGRPMRYWRLCRTLAAQGHAVVWWSSDFSHRRKQYRTDSRVAEHPDGFQLRLVHTPSYRRNVGLDRWRNHRAFGCNWEAAARQAVDARAVAKPERIVVSLPPLETAVHAFRLRTAWACPVVVDIQDAWPETCLRLLPRPRLLRETLGRLCLAPFFLQARRACRGADGISACARTYLDLAIARGATGPGLFCPHGTRLDPGAGTREFPARFTAERPLCVLYLGSMGPSYDLATAVAAVARLRRDSRPIEFHLAGQGPQEARLRRMAPACATFHGYLRGEAFREQFRRAHVGLIPMDPESWVGIPNKLVDYCAAGLPVVSCLGGETAALLDTCHAGFHYVYRDPASLAHVLASLLDDPALLAPAARGSVRLAQERFGDTETSESLARFVTVAVHDHAISGSLQADAGGR